MKWTNKHNLPAPIASAIIGDPYHHKAMEEVYRQAWEDYGIRREEIDSGHIPVFSVTGLIKPVKMTVLEKRYDDKIESDVSDGIYRLFGRMIHELLSSSQGTLSEHRERRLVASIDGALVTGEPDLMDGGIIDDYKVIAVHALQRGVKVEWEQQLNSYAAIVRKKIAEGYDLELPRQLRIIPILRDWLKSNTVKHEYPPAAASIMPVEMWPELRSQEFLRARIKAHLAARSLTDEQLLDCSEDETWTKPESWAVIRKGSSRATKVIRVAGAEGRVEAELEAASRNAKLKKNQEPLTVEHRPGEATRCLNFCAVAPFCQQFKNYKAVAWNLSGPKEEGEEVLAE